MECVGPDPEPALSSSGNDDSQKNETNDDHNSEMVQPPQQHPLPPLPLCQVDRYWLQKLVWRHNNSSDAPFPAIEQLSKIPIYASAPMVDQSDLPFRLHVRKYGTNLCFTPMIHAKLFCTQKMYFHKFRTDLQQQENHDNAKDVPLDRPLIAQLCGSDPEMLLQCALKVQDHCDGIDLNCGCPQGIARRGNYGAFLLEQEETLLQVVRYLAPRLSVPLSVKVRLLPDKADLSHKSVNADDAVEAQSYSPSLQLYQKLVDAGAHLLTIHGRTRHQKKQFTGQADWSAIRQAAQMLQDRIPILANGSIASVYDVQECLRETKADGVMSSEAILEYPPLFEPLVEAANTGSPLPPPSSSGNHRIPQGRRVGRLQLAREYLDLAQRFPPEHGGQGSGFKCIRVHVHRFLHADLQAHTYLRDAVVRARNVEELQASLDLVEELHKTMQLKPEQEELSWYFRHWNDSSNTKEEDETPQNDSDGENRVPPSTNVEEDEEEDADRMEPVFSSCVAWTKVSPPVKHECRILIPVVMGVLVLVLSIGWPFFCSAALFGGDCWERSLLVDHPTTHNNEDFTHNGVLFKHHPPGSALSSKVHCIGENFNPTHGWRHRSCQFHNLCLDIKTGKFVVYPSAQEQRLHKLLAQRQESSSSVPIITVSSLLSFETSSMPIGSIRPEMAQNDVDGLQWFPQVETAPPYQGFYMIPSNIVMFPIQPHNSAPEKEGGDEELDSVVQDDYWSLLRLLDIFNLATSPLRAVVPVWTSSCESSSSDNKSSCQRASHEYAQSMFRLDKPSGASMESIESDHDTIISKMKKSTIICAPLAVSGIGMLADDPSQHHEWISSSSTSQHPWTHNIDGGKQNLESKGVLMDLGLFSSRA